MVMNKLLADELRKFVNTLKSFNVDSYYEHSIGDLRKDDESWINWKDKPGVYVFIQDGCFKYVGRALTNGLGSRAYEQINGFGDPDWDIVIKDDNTIIGFICLKIDDWFVATALEAYLINLLNPPFNKRIA